MKKFYYLFLSAALIFLFENISFAQKASNPFSVKQKNNLKSEVIKPLANLLNISEIKATDSNNDEGYIYKSIPFKMPFSNSNNNFTNARYDKNGFLMLVEGGPKNGLKYEERNDESILNAAHQYLKSIETQMQIKNSDTEFESIKVWADYLNQTHIKMQQYFKGVKVFSGQVILHGSNGLLNAFNGTYYPTPIIDDVSPLIDNKSAELIALNNVSQLTTLTEVNSFNIADLEYEIAVSELVIYHIDRDINSEKLAWHITLRPNVLDRWEYFVDAKNGEIIHKFENTCTDGPTTANATDLNGVNRTINTYQIGSNYYMINTIKPMFNAGQSVLPDNPVGAIITFNANNTPKNDFTLYHVSSSNNTWSDPSTVSAHYNGNVTYDYYLNTHARNSINGNGGTIYAIVNISDNDGSSLANAFWNGQAMFYGNGGGIFYPLAGGLDVAAHEMTHGIVQNTANLIYEYESGAINEAMADISGAMVDRSNWQIGETITPNDSQYYPTGTLRDMSNPHNGGSSFSDNGYQPMHMNEKYTGNQDNGGVHLNSGIINYAFYQIAQSISKEKAEKLFYRALSTYLTQNSQFIDCRLAFEQAAKDIYGNNSTEHNAVINSFYSVGIGDPGSGGGGGSEPPGQIGINPGQDYILSYDVNPLDQNTLYISSTTGNNFIPISQTKLKSRPSLIDNGSVGVMITQVSEMSTIETTSPYNENIISNETIWDNVAVSKDGSRIAAITTSVDSAIYVYDYGKAQWAKFHLYNPTFTDGVVLNNVLYADALEWDYTGQYLIYDAYNELQNNSGQNIDYWDVGFIKVWNNSTNNWGDGNIFKLFSGLPEGVSIGNPSLSKNTPFILAFDYFDSNSGATNIMGANLETGDVNTIYENSILGYPNYSKLDDKIVFSAKSSGTEVVGLIGLGADKISPQGTATDLIDVAKWPVWYATGNRNLMDIDENISNSAVLTNVFPNPVTNQLNININADHSEDYKISLYNIFGQLVLEKDGITNTGITQNFIDISKIPIGTYIVNIALEGKAYNHKIVKTN